MKYSTKAAFAKSAAIAAFTAALVSTGASAHHSGAAYDGTKTVEIQGVLEKSQIMNPHSWYWINVARADGGSDKWAIEGGSAGQVARAVGADLSVADVKKIFSPGQKVSAKLHPVRDGRKSGEMISITLETGQVINFMSTTGN
ncbi:MAG: DUF6152 family protein [Steroidobacteraceae bacterium]